MRLDDRQLDALRELVNIGFGRASAALSRLVGQRVVLGVPDVIVIPVDDLASALARYAAAEVATVHQIFSGQVSGDALLMLDYDSAAALINLLSGSPAERRRLNASDREALVEIGNILLNAYVGSFGNVLKTHVTFAVPRLKLDAVEDMLASLTFGEDGLKFAVVVTTKFQVAGDGVEGMLVLILGVASLEKLFALMGQEGLLGG